MIAGSSARPGGGSHARLHQLPNVRKTIHPPRHVAYRKARGVGLRRSALPTPRNHQEIIKKSSPAEPPLARLVEMSADQLPERCRIIEFELHRERHDAVGDAFAAAE